MSIFIKKHKFDVNSLSKNTQVIARRIKSNSQQPSKDDMIILYSHELCQVQRNNFEILDRNPLTLTDAFIYSVFVLMTLLVNSNSYRKIDHKDFAGSLFNKGAFVCETINYWFSEKDNDKMFIERMKTYSSLVKNAGDFSRTLSAFNDCLGLDYIAGIGDEFNAISLNSNRPFPIFDITVELERIKDCELFFKKIIETYKQYDF